MWFALAACATPAACRLCSSSSALLVLIYSVVTTRTVFGRHVYAIGGNLTAATLSGVKVKWVNFGIMLNMGFLAGVAGVLFSVAHQQRDSPRQVTSSSSTPSRLRSSVAPP